MENFDETQDALRVKKCAEEVIELFKQRFPDNFSYSYTVLVYLIVGLTDKLDVDPKFVMRSIEESFQVNELLKAQVPNEFVN